MFNYAQCSPNLLLIGIKTRTMIANKYLLISKEASFLMKTFWKCCKISVETVEFATIKMKNIRTGILLDFPSKVSSGRHQTQEL